MDERSRSTGPVTPPGGGLRAWGVCLLLVCGTVLGLLGTDLVLPAVPSLPEALGGSPARAQLVLAAYAAGSGLGLLAFGELGSRVDPRWLLVGSLVAFAGSSLAAAASGAVATLVLWRVLQGTSGAAPAVFAPGMIRLLFDEQRAIGAMGVLASVEALVPALAPLLGVWLLELGGWRLSFRLLGALALALAVLVALRRERLPAPSPREGERRHVGYGTLLTDRVFLRYAGSHAFTLGALLTFVFGAPAVITGALGGSLGDFVRMQIAGIATFVLASNLAGPLALRVGTERVVLAGSVISAAGAVALLLHGLAGADDPARLPWLFVPMNLGLGLRGPPGFLRAVQASKGDDARGAALVMLAVLALAALGTATVAPWITVGLVPLTAVAAALSVTGVILLVVLPPPAEDAE
jgi:MFS family permease